MYNIYIYIISLYVYIYIYIHTENTRHRALLFLASQLHHASACRATARHKNLDEEFARLARD